MGKLWAWASGVMTVAGSLLAFTAATPFQEAKTNLASWLPEVIVNAWPWLRTSAADYGTLAIAVVLIGSAALVAVRNFRRGGIMPDDERGHGEGLRRKGDLFHDITVAGFQQGFVINGTQDVTLSSTAAIGDGHPNSVGYDIQDSKRINIDRAVALNNATGFRVRRSEDTSLTDTRADGNTPVVGTSGLPFYPERMSKGKKQPKAVDLCALRPGILSEVDIPVLQWEDIDDDLVLHYTPSKTSDKTGIAISYPLTKAPMVLEELQHWPAEMRRGPVIVSEETGLPYRARIFAQRWTVDRKTAGLPKTLWARDLRASGITEGRASAATIDDAAKVAGHKSKQTTSRIYDRAVLEAADRFADARLQRRERSGNGSGNER